MGMPCCLDLYKMKTMMEDRVLVFSKRTDVKPNQEFDPWCIRIGKLTTMQENELNALKGASLKTHMKEWADATGKPIELTQENILQAIDRMNALVAEKLGTTVRTVKLYVPPLEDDDSNDSMLLFRWLWGLNKQNCLRCCYCYCYGYY